MAQNVAQVAHIAWYLVMPLILLGVFALWGFEWSLGKSVWHKLAAGFMVMVFYIGNTGLFHLLIERILLA
jgi:membrane protein YdbS with pleckstrin-like domain